MRRLFKELFTEHRCLRRERDRGTSVARCDASMQTNIRMIQRLSIALLLSVSVISGCSGEKKEAAAAQPAARKAGSVAPRQAVVSVPAGPYRPVDVPGGGRLTGTADFDGSISNDSVFSVPADQPGCGPTITLHLVDHT